MKKITLTIRSLLITIALMGIMSPLITLADAPPPGNPGGSGSSSSSSSSSDGTVSPDELFYQFVYKNTDTSQTNIGAVNNIATSNSWQVVLANVIKTMLNISGGLALIALTVGGVFLVTARGKTEQIDKGKKILVYSIIGLVIIAISYALVIGVSDLQFFTPGAGGGATTGGSTTGGTSSAPAAGGATTPGGSNTNPPPSP